MHVTHPVDKPACLLCDRCGDARVGVTCERDAKRGGQVEVLVAVDVTNVAPVCLLPEDGERLAEEGDVPRLHRAKAPG